MVYNLKYDSVHGRFPYSVEQVDDSTLLINGKKVVVTSEKDPKNIPWGQTGATFVCESTGAFLSQEAAAGHLLSGAKKVILSAPAKDASPTYVYGVNHNSYKPD